MMSPLVSSTIGRSGCEPGVAASGLLNTQMEVDDYRRKPWRLVSDWRPIVQIITLPPRLATCDSFLENESSHGHQQLRE